MLATDDLINKIIHREWPHETRLFWLHVKLILYWLVTDSVTVQTGLITALFAMINLALYLAIASILLFVFWLHFNH